MLSRVDQLYRLRLAARDHDVDAIFNLKAQLWPTVWALECCPPGLLQWRAGPAVDLARFFHRRRAHKGVWRIRRGRDECLRALVDSTHPQETGACVVRLLELHGDRAIPALLDCLSDRDDRRASDACFALGRLGRAILPEVKALHRRASPRLKDRICEALWYLGPRAAQIVLAGNGFTDLIDLKTSWGRALVLALESAGVNASLAGRLHPVWPDENAVERLSSFVFSLDTATRLYGVKELFAADLLPRSLRAHLGKDRNPAVRTLVMMSLQGYPLDRRRVNYILNPREQSLADLTPAERASVYLSMLETGGHLARVAAPLLAGLRLPADPRLGELVGARRLEWDLQELLVDSLSESDCHLLARQLLRAVDSAEEPERHLLRVLVWLAFELPEAECKLKFWVGASLNVRNWLSNLDWPKGDIRILSLLGRWTEDFSNPEVQKFARQALLQR